MTVPSGPERRPQPGQPLAGEPGAGPLVAVDARRPARSRRRSRRPAGWRRRGRASGRRRRPARARETPNSRREQVGGRPHVGVAHVRPARTAPARSGRARPPPSAARTARGRSTPTPRRRRAPRPARRAAATPPSDDRGQPAPALPVDGQRRARVTGSPACSAATRATSPPGPMQLPSTHLARSGSAGDRARRRRRRTGAARSAAVHRGQRAARRADRACGAPATITGRVRLGTVTRRPGPSCADQRSGRRRPARRRSAARSTLPAGGHGPAGQVEPEPRPLRRGQVLARPSGPRPAPPASASDGGDHLPEPGVRRRRRRRPRPGWPAQGRLDVVDEHGGAAGDARPRHPARRR